MAGNTFGHIFRVTNWGESHGRAIGVVVDGCPAKLPLTTKEIQSELNRRRPGQSEVTTVRQESDQVEIFSGVYQGQTTGTPIFLIIYNRDVKQKDYSRLKEILRPGHADYTYQAKYGIRDPYGGGRSSARITAGHVAASAIARKILRRNMQTEILAYVQQIRDIFAEIDVEQLTRKQVESNPVRCPDQKAAQRMQTLLEKVRSEGDSVGGVIECQARNVLAGLGEPVFDKLDAALARAVMSINAVKGVEIGRGFDSANHYGSEINDSYYMQEGKVATRTNNAGGVLGGISTGMPIILRAAFKPTPTIGKSQETVTTSGESVTFQAEGRHDPCVVSRAVPIVEAMVALVLCDHYLWYQARQSNS